MDICILGPRDDAVLQRAQAWARPVIDLSVAG